MPPKAKIGKSQIIDMAFEIVRQEGVEALNARYLAKKLNVSTQPIFSNFNKMTEILQEVVQKSAEFYHGYTKAAMESGKYPEYKASGMAYIAFAKEHKNLFKLLFMRSRSEQEIKDDVEAVTQSVLKIIAEQNGVTVDEAYKLHIAMWVVVHGIASMAVTGYLTLTESDCSDILTNAYLGAKAVRFKN